KENNEHHGLQVLDEQELAQAKPQPTSHALFVLVRSDLVVASPDLEVLQAFDAQLQQGGGGLASTAFGQRLSEAYKGGTELLFGADLQQMESRAAYHVRRHDAFEQTG